MSTEPQHDRWIAHARDVANGTAPIPTDRIERVARQHNLDHRLAERHIRNTFTVLLAALNGTSRRSVIEFFGTAYKHDHKEQVRQA
jgi:erythromycin esterase-like protein